MNPTQTTQEIADRLDAAVKAMWTAAFREDRAGIGDAYGTAIEAIIDLKKEAREASAALVLMTDHHYCGSL